MAWLRSLVGSVRLAGYFLRFGGEVLLRRPRSRREGAEWLHRFCAAVLRGFDVPVSVEGAFPPRGALISNHLGYLDIVVLAALSPCVYCAKAEMEHWPILGFMTRVTGTVYVDRGRGGSAARAAEGMRAAAEAGLPVVFFPEGTTTNGAHMLPFRSGLLAQALSVDEPIWPAFIRYTLAPGNGKATLADDVHFWGDTPMLKHLFRFLGLRGIRATVRFGPEPIRFQHGAEERKLAALEAREAIESLSGRPDPLTDEERQKALSDTATHAG